MTKKSLKYDSLNHAQKMPIVFTSFSKKNFYLRAEISKFVLQQESVPISPFMNFDYNLGYIVNKDEIRVANNTLIRRSDELWVFGAIADGVLMEIYLAKKYKKSVRYFLLSSDSRTFREVSEDEIVLEDVSPWMWEWVRLGKDLERWHPRLRFTKTYPLVYPAYSKRNFYLQMHISEFCMNKKAVPLNPFMLFRYFLGDAVSREIIYRANAEIVKLCDELWCFGDIADGVLKEIRIKKIKKQPVKYFKLASNNPIAFRKIPASSALFEEEELEKYRQDL